MPVFLPPSLSDLVPIELHKDNDDGDVTEAEEEAREERESSESSEEEGDELPSGIWSATYFFPQYQYAINLGRSEKIGND